MDNFGKIPFYIHLHNQVYQHRRTVLFGGYAYIAVYSKLYLMKGEQRKETRSSDARLLVTIDDE